MYKYKLNNSYTVYVNWSYYSECAMICKDAHKKEKRVNSMVSKKPAITAAPLPRVNATLILDHSDTEKVYH